MAGIQGQLVTAENATTTSLKTLLQLVAPANQRVLVRGFRITFKGVTPTDPPIRFDILRQTSAGTATALAATKASDLSATAETLQTAGQQNATVEPTGTDVLVSGEVPGQWGQTEWFPHDRPIVVPGGTRLGLRVLNGGTSVSAVAAFHFEE